MHEVAKSSGEGAALQSAHGAQSARQQPVEVKLPASLAWRLKIRGTIEDAQGRRITVLPERRSRCGRRTRTPLATTQPVRNTARGGRIASGTKESTVSSDVEYAASRPCAIAAIGNRLADGSTDAAQHAHAEPHSSSSGSVASSERRLAKLRQLRARAAVRRSSMRGSAASASRDAHASAAQASVHTSALWLHEHARALAAHRDERNAPAAAGPAARFDQLGQVCTLMVRISRLAVTTCQLCSLQQFVGTAVSPCLK